MINTNFLRTRLGAFMTPDRKAEFRGKGSNNRVFFPEERSMSRFKRKASL